MRVLERERERERERRDLHRAFVFLYVRKS